ncbi:unnamed protein product [Alopecurus aequalis]
MEGLDEVYKLQRFLPTPQEAVGYFLPRLLTGETLLGAEKLIHRAEVYACEPKDLAEQFAPVPTAVKTGDRFFFTTCRRKKDGRCKRLVGAGTWTGQTTEDIYDKGVLVGEVATLSFKKSKKSTGWVMKEYRSLVLPEAVVADGEMVLCKIYLAQHAPPAARQESEAYKLRRQEGAEPAPAPQPEPVSARAQKRPAPVAAADMSSCKKMRVAAPVPAPASEVEYEDYPAWFTPAASTPAPPCFNEMWTSAPAPASDEVEYEDCPTWFTPATSTPTPPCFNEMSTSAPAPSDEVEYQDCPTWCTPAAADPPCFNKMWTSAPAPAPALACGEDRPVWFIPEADDLSCTMEELLGEQTDPVEAENKMEHQAFDQDMDQQLAAPISRPKQILAENGQILYDEDIERFVEQLLAGLHEQAELEKGKEKIMCYSDDLHSPSLQGHRQQFSSFAAVSLIQN